MNGKEPMRCVSYFLLIHFGARSSACVCDVDVCLCYWNETNADWLMTVMTTF